MTEFAAVQEEGNEYNHEFQLSYFQQENVDSQIAALEARRIELQRAVASARQLERDLENKVCILYFVCYMLELLILTFV